MKNNNRPQIDPEQPTTILTQLGVQSCLVKIARGECRASFGLNKNHNNHLHKALNPTNVGDPNHEK